jgi:site-specific recombinase XerD
LLNTYLSAVPNRRRQAKATNTIKAYESDFRAFEAFCARNGRCSLPATSSISASYGAEAAHTLKANTVARDLNAIRWAHESAGFASPIKDEVVRTPAIGVILSDYQFQ